MNNANRRGFIKATLSASVLISALPHQLLGRLFPTIIENENSIQGVFTVSLNEFPLLKTVNGSVKIDFVGVGNSATAVVTRTSKTTFAACSDLCTHSGCSVDAFNSITNKINCPCHNSAFSATGKVLQGPAGADLTVYKTTYSGGDSLLVELPMLANDVKDINTLENYIREIRPNPITENATVEFSIKSTGYVVLTIHTIIGDEVLRLADGRFDAGVHTIPFTPDTLSGGTYICRIHSSVGLVASRKLTVVR